MDHKTLVKKASKWLKKVSLKHEAALSCERTLLLSIIRRKK